MTKNQIYRIAREQSAMDMCCAPEDFLKKENVVVTSGCDERARRYLELPFACNLVSYGKNIVASVSEELRETVCGYISRFPAFRCFETPQLLCLDDEVRPRGFRVCFMAEYFLPNSDCLPDNVCPYPVRLLEPPAFDGFYLPAWSNALCAQRKAFDRLCAAAYDGDTLVGLAGASEDCDGMWQIGIDVLPAYRRRGIAAALTVHLAREVFARGKIPFYCAAWSNLASVRNALKCGFLPAWTELTVKDARFTARMNSVG